MNRAQLIEKLMSEGFSEKTLVNFNDKQLGKFADKILKEAQTVTTTKTVYNSKDPEDVVALNTALKDPKVDKTKIEVKETDKKWIQKAIDPKKKGQLHKDLDVPQDETIPVSKLKSAAKKGGKVGRRARMALNLRNLNEFIDNVVENNYHSLTTKREMVELIKDKINVISEKETGVKIPEFINEFEANEPAVKPDVKPAPTKPDTDSPRRERPRHPGQRPLDPNKQPLPNPAPKAGGKTISSDEAKTKIMQMVHKIFTEN